MLVSVIIPTFNAQGFLANTLQSVLAQTYSNIEVLVVDDGSSDDTAKIVDSFHDDRVRFIALEHQGAPGHCRNHGLEEAKGELLIYFDSDDYMEPTMLEKMVACYQEKPVDIVICQPRYRNILSNEIVSNEQEKFFALDSYIWNDLFEINPFPCNKLYQRSFLIASKVRYEERVFNQDLGYFLSLLFHKPTFTILKEELMEYRIRPNSITTSSKTRKKHMDILVVFESVFKEYTQYPCPEMRQGLEKMFIKTMLFKIGFFDPASEQEEIKKIRSFLYEKCPTWYKHAGFKEQYTLSKRVYNQLLVRWQWYSLLGSYKKLKRKVR